MRYHLDTDFLVYALSMFLWGAVFDRIGNRLGFAVAVVVWSVAQIGTAAARGVVNREVLETDGFKAKLAAFGTRFG